MKFQANDSRVVVGDKDGSREVGAYTQADLDRARADGYNDGFRQGKQSRTADNKDRCEHGILWSMECLTCPPQEYVAATPPATPSNAAMQAAAQQIIATVLGWSDLDDLGTLAPDHPNRKYVEAEVIRIITRHLAGTVSPETPVGDEDRDALLKHLKESHATCLKNADDTTKSDTYRKMMEHFAEAGRQIIEMIEEKRYGGPVTAHVCEGCNKPTVVVQMTDDDVLLCALCYAATPTWPQQQTPRRSAGDR